MDVAILSSRMTAVRQRLNRNTVIEMAVALADSEGIDAVTLQRIADDAGVKQPALYRHVSGIDDVLTQLALRARDMLAASLHTAHSGLTRDAAVQSVAVAWRSFVQQHPGLYSATDRVPSVGDPAVEASLRLVVAELDASLLGYRLSDTERGHCARSLRSALHGFCVLEKDHGHPEPYAIDAGLDNLIHLFCRGVESMEQ